jgi:hypothetical protein
VIREVSHGFLLGRLRRRGLKGSFLYSATLRP